MKDLFAINGIKCIPSDPIDWLVVQLRNEIEKALKKLGRFKLSKTNKKLKTGILAILQFGYENKN